MTKVNTKTKKSKAKIAEKSAGNFNAAEEEAVFAGRLQKHYDELKWLYFELFPESENEDSLKEFSRLTELMKKTSAQRRSYLKELDADREIDYKWYKKSSMLGMMMHLDSFAGTLKGFEKRIPYLKETGVTFLQLLPSVWHRQKKHAEGTVNDFCRRMKGIGDAKDFAKFAQKCHEHGISIAMKLAVNSLDETSEWTLDYTLPADFVNIAANILDTANYGVDMIQIDIVRSTWMDDGGALYNVLRMLRLVCEIACPAAILIGKLDMPPEMAAAYAGGKQKPQCHLLDDIAMRDAVWHTAATQNTVLLRRQLDLLAVHPWLNKINLNYLRSNYGLDWDLDYGFLQTMSMDEEAHKNYLNEFFCGKFPGSAACGALFTDERTDRQYVCGTAAALCGIERCAEKKDKDGIALAIKLDLMLHAIVLIQQGIPLIYSGDEIAAYNDDSFRKDKDIKSDARYMHNGPFNWRKAGRRKIKGSIQARVYQGICKMQQLRSTYGVFHNSAPIYTIDTWDDSTLAVVREDDEAKLICLFNFAKQDRTAWIKSDDGEYTDLLTGKTGLRAADVPLKPYEMMWLWRSKQH